MSVVSKPPRAYDMLKNEVGRNLIGGGHPMTDHEADPQQAFLQEPEQRQALELPSPCGPRSPCRPLSMSISGQESPYGR